VIQARLSGLFALVAALVLLSACGSAQQPASPRRFVIGYLIPGTETSAAGNLEAFRAGLLELGYAEGEHFTLEARYGGSGDEQLPAHAADLARLNVDVIVTGGTAAIRAAQQASSTIPIVFATVGDPVAQGFVDSLAHPGRNITGVTQLAGTEHARRLELLKEASPGLSRVLVVIGVEAGEGLQQIQSTAPSLGVEVLPLTIGRSDQLDGLLASVAGLRVDGLIQASGAQFIDQVPRIAEFAIASHLPSVWEFTNAASAGGMMQYGNRARDNYRRAATYVDKILKGARAGDIPVERPTTFDFVINLKTAQAIGVTIPPTLLAQATEIIQ
jgi:putative ABC transport system substrate-binding protein